MALPVRSLHPITNGDARVLNFIKRSALTLQNSFPTNFADVEVGQWLQLPQEPNVLRVWL